MNLKRKHFMNEKFQGKNLMMIGLVVILAFIGFYVLNAPDKRSAGERVGDAIDQLGDRTPGEKLGDAVRDVGDDINKSTNQ
jgi:hypothetical protein